VLIFEQTGHAIGDAHPDIVHSHGKRYIGQAVCGCCGKLIAQKNSDSTEEAVADVVNASILMHAERPHCTVIVQISLFDVRDWIATLEGRTVSRQTSRELLNRLTERKDVE